MTKIKCSHSTIFFFVIKKLINAFGISLNQKIEKLCKGVVTLTKKKGGTTTTIFRSQNPDSQHLNSWHYILLIIGSILSVSLLNKYAKLGFESEYI